MSRRSNKDRAYQSNRNQKSIEDEFHLNSDDDERDTGMMIRFPPMFNCASNEDDLPKDTSPYEFDMEDDYYPRGGRNNKGAIDMNRTTSISTIETNGISLHETEHLLEDGTRVVRTETVDQAGFVLKVNETRTPPQKEHMFKFHKSPEKPSSPAAIAILPRSATPPPPPRSQTAEEKKEDIKEETVHLTFTPEKDDNENDEIKKKDTSRNPPDEEAPNNTAKKNGAEDDEDEDDEICGLSRRRFYIMMIVILLIVLIGAIVGIVVASSSSSSPASSPATAQAPAPITPAPIAAAPTTNAPIEIVIVSPAPTVAPLTGAVPQEYKDLGSILLPNQNIEALSIFSPLYRALAWLLEDDNTETNLGISLTEDSQELRERFAAATLYFSTNGKGWINSKRWMTTTTICNWEGISCRGGNATSLVFNANRLEGELPSTIGELSWLEILNLPQNALRGTLSTELGQLTNLEHLNLYSNSMQGTIPTQFGNLQNMVELTLWMNDLNGQLPTELGLLSRLEKLDVAQNAFSGTIPTQFGNLRAVRKLFLDGNALSGSLPSELGKLGRLETLHVPNNRLSGIVPMQLQNAPNLIDVKFTANSFQGGLNNLFCDRSMTNFYSDCASNQLNCQCCTHCCGEGGCFENLVTLPPTMAPTSRLGTFADILIGPDKAKQNAILSNTNSPQYKALMWINDRDYPANDSIVNSDSLQERYGLAVLYYATGGDSSWSGGGSWLSPGLNQCDWEFVACIASQVRFLTLVNNNMVGSIPEEISKLVNLRSLEIRNNPMMPSPIPSQIGLMSKLSNLSLEGISLTGTIPTHLMQLQFLTSLELSQNDLTGTIPTRIQTLFNLKFLDLSSNALVGGLPSELATLRLIQSVELHENSLSGTIPIEWGAQFLSATLDFVPSLENLQKLRLDGNQLTGNLPIQIGELQNLREFHLHDNLFTGVLPTQLMDLPVLQYLKMSSNQLRGTLHTYIGNLRKLSYFDVQDNNFSG